ncbi:hypothetical protein [Vibrio cyclitrophicus]|uniref:Uncharacterized protein n=2 Tax=Vibrio cyclitrophicus TaxID=47951 RepID=A0ACD5FV52_9VIBR|nr:hypothetical protein [Vibrio cyclitrophicus]
MLKNWTVITQATLDVMAREHYLLNKRHRNHKQTEKIINIYGSAKQSLNILRNCERYKLKQAARRKGGRPPTESIEFVFTLPKGVRPATEQWRKMLSMLMVDLASHLGISTNQLATIVRAVLHQQNQDPCIKGSGDHMHIVIAKFTDDLTYLSELQRKSTTRLLKTSFNNAVLKVVDVDCRTYPLKKPYIGDAKKRVPTWKVKAVRRQEEIKAQEKQLKRMINQANKWLEAFERHDYKQMRRQYNRLKKESGTLETVSDDNSSLYEFMLQLIGKVEAKGQQRDSLSRRLPKNDMSC